MEVDHKDMGTATEDRRRGCGDRGEELAIGGPQGAAVLVPVDRAAEVAVCYEGFAFGAERDA